VIRVILIGLLVMLIARAFWRVMDGVIEGASGTERRTRPQSRPVRLVRDPVCGTHVPVDTSLSLTVGGTTHHFCSEGCRDSFRRAS
jgi:YHS domain-containing protein